MTKQEFIARLTIQCLQGVRWDSVGNDRYAIYAAQGARLAAEKIEKEDPNFFKESES